MRTDGQKDKLREGTSIYTTLVANATRNKLSHLEILFSPAPTKSVLA
jgi:hypothetical protein